MPEQFSRAYFSPLSLLEKNVSIFHLSQCKLIYSSECPFCQGQLLLQNLLMFSQTTISISPACSVTDVNWSSSAQKSILTITDLGQIRPQLKKKSGFLQVVTLSERHRNWYYCQLPGKLFHEPDTKRRIYIYCI